MNNRQLYREREQARIVLLVTREYDGLAGAGGVKDVCRQLAETLAGDKGLDVRVILPRYGFIEPQALGFSPLPLAGTSGGVIGNSLFDHCFSVDMDYIGEQRREPVAAWSRMMSGVTVIMIEAERFGDKLGVYTYTPEEEQAIDWQKSGTGHYDYFAMNILLQKAALDLMIIAGETPWVIHCHDGHAATLPLMMRELTGYRHYFRKTGAVVTIHNAGLGYHQEVADLEFAQAVTDLSDETIGDCRLGLAFDPFLAASTCAVMNTVSENYGRELQETSEDARTGWLGHTLRERGVKLKGVTNGIDPSTFNPERHAELGLVAPFNIGKGELGGKRTCKEAMLVRTGLVRPWEFVEQFGTLNPNQDAPLFTFVGRLTEQKGVDLVLQSVPRFFIEQEPEAQLLILGSGDSSAEKQLVRLAEGSEARGRICFLKGFDPRMANQVYAAGDFFLIPSLYEPCGLTDYMAQLMGNLPIVHHVGGLVKVVDGVTGFAYKRNSLEALELAMQRAVMVYGDPAKMLEMQQAAVSKILEHHTWQTVKDQYLLLYEEARSKAPGNR